VARAADELGVATYLDGARLFNAAAATGRSLAELAKPFRLVSVALSKGLGCPAGSVLAGGYDDLVSAKRIRRMYGGAMRQAGVLGAAGLYALDHNIERLSEDHRNARLMADQLAKLSTIDLDLSTVQTNMVVFRTRPGVLDAATLTVRAKEKGVLISPFAKHTVRVATHLNVSKAECEQAAEVLTSCLSH
jgi:threonine aldolase